MTVTVPPAAGAPGSPVVIRLVEPLPAAARPIGGLCVTDNFLAVGTTRNGTWTATKVPTGLNLVLEITPLDRSAPTSRLPVVGPARRGQAVAIRAPLAPPFPRLQGRVLDSEGGPFRERAVAIEVRARGRLALIDVTTDADGRFDVPARITAPAATTGSVTVVPGRLRHGPGRLSITRMPTGPTARAHLRMPATPRSGAATIALGDLRLGVDR